MIKSDKKLKELSALLAVKNTAGIREAILSLRDKEPFEGAIGILVTLYNTTSDESIRKTIGNFMNDLKDQAVTSEVIKEIRKPLKHETVSMLVSSCWQSGLDYSAYSDELVDIFLESDYTVALECLTVIEESAGRLTSAKKGEIISYLENYEVKPANEKAGLTKELISILQESKNKV